MLFYDKVISSPPSFRYRCRPLSPMLIRHATILFTSVIVISLGYSRHCLSRFSRLLSRCHCIAFARLLLFFFSSSPSLIVTLLRHVAAVIATLMRHYADIVTLLPCCRAMPLCQGHCVITTLQISLSFSCHYYYSRLMFCCCHYYHCWYWCVIFKPFSPHYAAFIRAIYRGAIGLLSSYCHIIDAITPFIDIRAAWLRLSMPLLPRRLLLRISLFLW